MLKPLTQNYKYSDEVSFALKKKSPIVALESTVITHGLPRPENYHLGKKMEEIVRSNGATPATIAVLDGKVHVGLNSDEITRLAELENLRKISRKDLGVAQAFSESGGTTIAATLIVANSVGIKVLATGGIGGVHRGSNFDISADLLELSRTPMIVVCSGAKAILDLPSTIEYLETIGVPILGYKTSFLPAFYSIDSGLSVTARVDAVKDVIEIATTQWNMGISSSVLVTVPPPKEYAIPADLIEEAIDKALIEAEKKSITGQKLTPFLLNHVSKFSSGKSLQTNLHLLHNNALIASYISVKF